MKDESFRQIIERLGKNNMKEISFREALRKLINGEYVMVKNSKENLLIKMINDKADLRCSRINEKDENIVYKLNDFGCEGDHFYEVKDDCIYLEVKAKYKEKETIEKYVILPDLKKNEEEIVIKIKDFMK